MQNPQGQVTLSLNVNTSRTTTGKGGHMATTHAGNTKESVTVFCKILS